MMGNANERPPAPDTAVVKFREPKSALDVLIAARAKIEKPENWLNRCPDHDEEADGRYCAARAIWSTASPSKGRAYEALAHACAVFSVPQFNDTHTHAEVLAAFDRAIEAERAKALS